MLGIGGTTGAVVNTLRFAPDTAGTSGIGGTTAAFPGAVRFVPRASGGVSLRRTPIVSLGIDGAASAIFGAPSIGFAALRSLPDTMGGMPGVGGAVPLLATVCSGGGELLGAGLLPFARAGRGPPSLEPSCMISLLPTALRLTVSLLPSAARPGPRSMTTLAPEDALNATVLTARIEP